MAKITFVHDELRDRLGVMCLSSLLRKHGHETEVRCNMGEKDIVSAVAETKPDIIGLSTCTIEHKFAIDFAGEIKKQLPHVLILMGGPHATFYPDVINESPIDLICRGEGDYSLLELLDRIEKKVSYEDVPNFHLKRGGRIIKNDVRSFWEDLDSLPYPDRDIYYKRYARLMENPTKTFMAMRGCPFDCTYCFNHAMIKLYEGKGKYVRMRSPAGFVREIKDVKEKYGMKWVQLNDDTLNLRKDWLFEFLDLYKKDVNLPFICNVRVDILDEETVKKLKAAGCDRANFGIEHGNPVMRKILLKRNITDEQIVNAGKWFEKYNIRVYVTNITGFPGESVSDFFDTVKINRKVKSEWAACFILQPFPGTEIHRYAKDKGYLDPGFSIDDLQHPHSCFFSYRRTGSAIKQENIKKLMNYQKFFHYIVKFPWLTPLVNVLVKLPHNRFFDFIFQLPNYRKFIKYAKDNKEKRMYIKRLLKTLTG